MFQKRNCKFRLAGGYVLKAELQIPLSRGYVPKAELQIPLSRGYVPKAELQIPLSRGLNYKFNNVQSGIANSAQP